MPSDHDEAIEVASKTPAPRGYSLLGHAHVAVRVESALHVVATPIGNLSDISVRALQTLAAVDLVACEDTRVTAKLFERFGLSTPRLPYHDHNAASMRPKILSRIKSGLSVALISDAGTPLISDPGYKLVDACLEAGLRVVAVPGPSAVMAALVASGLPTDSFFFDGFLPAKSVGRKGRLAELARIPAALVLFETGPRLEAALRDIDEVLPGRTAAVCRELTKMHEEVVRDTLPALIERYTNEEPKGEIVLVIGPPPAEAAGSADDLDEALKRALSAMSMKEAATAVAGALGLPRREVYARALALKSGK
jgi:16S rRNA (cytidine1402-2'-O)-methyltransferase